MRLKIGLLPLYVELYDKFWPHLREGVNKFYNTIVNEFKKKDIEVIVVPVCRLKKEFEDAVNTFEKNKVDAIVTLHLAYSPSLESADVLANTKLPIIVLDTTPSYGFGFEQEADEILYNHGIHGVQDMCNLLVRNKKEFYIEAGHWKNSDVIERVISDVRAARLAMNMRESKVGIVGQPFKGMGDFAIAPEKLKLHIGIGAEYFSSKICSTLKGRITDEEIEKEIEEDKKQFEYQDINQEIYRQSIIAGLVIRKWVEDEKLSAITVNFTDVDSNLGLPCMPFLEVSKAMAQRVGYAGEGDILTAALVGALLKVYPETSFAEMFCPDWEGNSIFLSHMGEMNLRLCAEKPLLAEQDFIFTDAQKPVVAYGRFKEGKAVIVNIAPGLEDKYTLIVSEGKMLGCTKDKMKDKIRGWFQPEISISEFLSTYSMIGGTHHFALVYGDAKNDIMKFGRMMGWNVVNI